MVTRKNRINRNREETDTERISRLEKELGELKTAMSTMMGIIQAAYERSHVTTDPKPREENEESGSKEASGPEKTEPKAEQLLA